MSLLVFALIVLIVVAPVCWAVFYIPFPPTPIPIKELMMVLILLVAVLIILSRAGWLAGI